MLIFFSDFTRGKGGDPPYLSEYTRKVIEQQCIATMLTHLGFKSKFYLLKNCSDNYNMIFICTDSYEDVMEALVDVLEVFMKNLCGQLRNANDSLLTGRISCFPVNILCHLILYQILIIFFRILLKKS